jgi:hypothetical protein
MSKYVPSTEYVRNIYGYRRFEVAEFDRWLAKHDAEVKAEAWDEGALYAAVECNAIDDQSEPWIATRENPYREVVE